jgi:hypothetical protein
MSGIDLRHHKEVLWAGALWCVAWIAALIGGVYWLAALIIVVGIVALGVWSTLGPQIKARLEKAGSIRQARVQDRPPPPEEVPPIESPSAKILTIEIPPAERDRLEFEYRFALAEADMQGALLAGVDLQQVDMRRANLRGADLRNANLWHTDLLGADLREANLDRADLRWACLARSNLKGASLRAANLWGANLREAEIDGADLRGANLWDATLGAQLAQAGALRGATMPDGSWYDGRLDLAGDVLEAQRQGINLNDPAARVTFYSVAEDKPLPVPDVPFRVVPERTHDPTEPVLRIALLPVDESQDAIGLDLRGHVLVGRGNWADIDLTPYQGGRSVSRRHAIIYPGQMTLTVVDLGSTNGTWHNGVWLPPRMLRVLTDGDIVAFGRLRFQVRIVEHPAGAV